MADLAALDDDALAEQAASGNAQALELLLERFAPVALRVACGVLPSREDARDATQTALLQAARQIATRWSGSSFRAWLCACAHGAAVNLAIRNASRKRRENLAAELKNETSAPAPDEQAQRQETLTMLRDELNCLPRSVGLLLSLHHVQGIPVSDIAPQLGLSIDACWQRLSRAREGLRRRLESRGVALDSPAVIALLGGLSGAARLQAEQMGRACLTGMGKTAMVHARAAVGISKGWLAYGAVAAIVLLAFALAPLYVVLPEDPPRKRRRPPPVQQPEQPRSGKQVGDDF